MTAEVLLVHGAWHGAWCFDHVARLLADAGVRVTALDLPGHGDDTGPFTDLYGDGARVTAALDRAADVVLLGHSYGGAVITEAGAHPAVRHLVYLAAFPLDLTESCQAAAVDEAGGLGYDDFPDLGAELAAADDGTTTLLPGAAACLYQDCSPPDVAWAMARWGPQPMHNLAQSPTTTAWREKPASYVVCADDRTVHPGLQRILARRCATSSEWPTGHSPFISRPERVADLLLAMI
jgi:pimeloyl-ACP methyl ester carboxylesterase